MTERVDSEGGKVVEKRRASGARPEGDPDAISLLGLANVFLRHRWVIVGFALLFATIFAGYESVQPTTFTASAAFTPQTGSASSQSNLSGIARQFGVAVPGSESTQSPAFYAFLVQSREVLSQAATSEYSVDKDEGEGGVTDGPRSGTLIDLLEIDAPRREARIASARSWLKEAIETNTDPSTGMVRVRVTTPWPDLSTQIADRLLELLEEYNTKRRQSQAAAERQFIGSRLKEARQDLREAEEQLRKFLENNRRYENSPELRFEHKRLQRKVDFHQQVVTSLAQAYEQAKMDEVRNTPVITEVERPRPPLSPDAQPVKLKALLGLIVGGVLGGGWALGATYLHTARREQTKEYQELSGYLRQTGIEIRRFLRSVSNFIRRMLR